MNQELKIILDEMCSRVGASNIDFRSDHWYEDYTWAEEEEKDFINWLADHLYKNREARKIFKYLKKNKRDCNKASNKFVLNYGWKTK